MEAKKRYYAKNRDKINEKAKKRSKEYYKKNADKINEKNKNYYEYKQFHKKFLLEDDVKTSVPQTPQLVSCY